MENKLVESFLYQTSTPLDTLLTERFNEHVKLTQFHPTYFLNFLMGLSTMLMAEDIRSKYGIKRVFFTTYDEEMVARIVILTDSGSGERYSKRTKVRTFDMRGIQTTDKRFLSFLEQKVMVHLLGGTTGVLPNSMTERTGRLYDEQNLERIDLNEYPIDYEVYDVNQEQVHRADPNDLQTRVKLNVKQSLSEIESKKQLKQNNDATKILDRAMIREFSNLNFKMTLLTDTKIITLQSDAHFEPDALLYSYEAYHNAAVGQSVELFKRILNGPNSAADVFKKISPAEGVPAECGFTHGLLFFLSYSYPSYIEVKQMINRAPLVVDGGATVDLWSKMLLTYKPKSTPTDNSMYKIPFLCVFSKQKIQRAALGRLALDEPTMSIIGEVAYISIKLRSNQIDSKLRKVGKRSDLVDDLFRWMEEVRTDSGFSETMVGTELLQNILKIRPASREYDFSERKYLSRYLAGWLSSSENTRADSYVLLSKEGNTGSTKFFIKSNKEKLARIPGTSENEQAPAEQTKRPANVLIVVREDPMAEMHFPNEVQYDETDTRFERLNEEDTLVVNIRQEYVHSNNDFLKSGTQKDFTRFAISSSFTESRNVIRSHEFFPLPKVPQSTLDDILDSGSSQGQMRLSELLAHGTYFARDKGDYEAYLDGILLNNECLKSATEGRSDHSDTSYFRRTHHSGRVTKINLKKVSNQLTKEKLQKIAESAHSETRHFDGQSLQVILSEKSDELQVKLLRKEQLVQCANPRVRRSLIGSCNIDSEEITIRGKTELDKLGVDKFITTKAYKSLEKISKILGYMMMGFMVRDAVSDTINKRYGALAVDIGFILTTAFSPTLGNVISSAGNNLIKSGSKLSGNLMKGLGFGIKRAISVYILVDLVKNGIAYAHDTNDTDAKLNMEIDAAFLAIDGLTIVAEIMGAGAIFGPIGEIAGALLILGLNIYQTVNTVRQIEKIIPLNVGEHIDESLRAFFHRNMEAYVQELINEKVANTKLLQDAVNYLQSQNRIGTYVTSSAELVGDSIRIHGDTVIDMRSSFVQTISRASPDITDSKNLHNIHMTCFLHQEQIEIEHEPGFWEKFTGFFSKIGKAIRSLDQLVHGNYTASLKAAFECDGCIKKNTPTCHNAFGISIQNSRDKAALFKLGNKSDLVWGYSDKPNIFVMAGGVKNITGGAKDDTFVVGFGPITGVLNGSNGEDILDLSSFAPDELTISGTLVNYRMGLFNSTLQIHSIETIIIPTNNTVEGYINVFNLDGIHRLTSSSNLRVQIHDNITAEEIELIIEFSGNANVINHAQTGLITYIMKKDEKNASLFIQDAKFTNHKIFLMENLFDIKTVVHQNGGFSFQTMSNTTMTIITSLESMNNTQIIFSDGSTLMSSGKVLTHATLTTALKIPEIESKYAVAVERLGIMMVAYSTTDAASISISHGVIKGSNSTLISQVLSNSDDHDTLMVLNGGQYLILINPNAYGNVEKTTIRSKNAKNITKVNIDLSAVIDFYSGDESAFVKVQGHLMGQYLNNLAILISLTTHDSDGATILLGKIIIEDILTDGFHEKIFVRNYGELRINKRELLKSSLNHRNRGLQEHDVVAGRCILTPLPIEFTSSFDVLILTPYNTEPFNKITVDTYAGTLDHYSINGATLVLTNFLRNFRNKTANIVTVFLESFYSVKKMETLHLMIGDTKIDLKKYREAMAPDFANFWIDMETSRKSG